MSRGAPSLLVALFAITALAGCVQDDDGSTPGAANIAESGAAGLLGGTHRAVVVGPDEGWFQFDAPAQVSSLVIEGSFPGYEAFTPIHNAVNAVGQPTPNQPWRIEDITDNVPAGVPVRIQTHLTHGSDGGTWVGGPNPIFWTYDPTGQGTGMRIDTVLVRGPEDAVIIGVWNSEAAAAAETPFSVDVDIETLSKWLPPAIAYGVKVGKEQSLQLEFDASPGTEAVWIWDAGDKFLGRFSVEDQLLTVDSFDPELRLKSGEWVVFVVEREPSFRMRVLGTEDLRPPEVRVMQQLTVTQGPWPVTGGQPLTETFDVPVVPFQVGFSYNTPQMSVDMQLALHDPAGKMVLRAEEPGAIPLGVQGFLNTDMGLPAVEPGTYELMYQDTQSTEMELDAWYVTYGR